jgi:cyclophilin family peptidyl-prolyl cis-trans isomerase
MRFFRSNNHLLWMGVLIFVALGVYGVMYLFQQRKSSQVEPGTYPHTDHERYEPTREYDEDVDDGAKHVQFADPIEDVANEPERVQPPPPQYVFLDVAKQDFLKDPYVGKIIIQLHPDVVPKTCANFAQLCAEKKYVNTPFHRVIKDFMLQSGDIVHQDGTGTYSIYGGEGSTFEDEAFALKHDRPGVLSMANSGPNTNGSQFFITTRDAPHLDGKHVVFGHVVQGLEFVHDIEREVTDANDSPIRKCYIMNCGVVDLNDLHATQLPSSPEPQQPQQQQQQQQQQQNSYQGASSLFDRQQTDVDMLQLQNQGTPMMQTPTNHQNHSPANQQSLLLQNHPPNEPAPFSL